MGYIFDIFGKSASGKDSIYKELMADQSLGLKGVVMYTTRPMRAGEADGVDYNFVTDADMEVFRAQGKVIEERTYHTVFGPWTYSIIDDGQIDLSQGNYLVEGVLGSFINMKEHFGESVLPVYIEVEDGERLLRAIARERKQDTPKYAEMCRRFLADDEDFSEDKLKAAGIDRRFQNNDFKTCISEIKDYIRSL